MPATDPKQDEQGKTGNSVPGTRYLEAIDPPFVNPAEEKAFRTGNEKGNYRISTGIGRDLKLNGNLIQKYILNINNC